eukprot:10394068-Heterocapsa_arctica.AAC.1
MEYHHDRGADEAHHTMDQDAVRHGPFDARSDNGRRNPVQGGDEAQHDGEDRTRSVPESIVVDGA